MNKIILFYKYVDLANPAAIVAWQKQLCKTLDLKGRIIIASEGINGTLGGARDAIDSYVSIMRTYESFSDIDFKENSISNDYFPRLRVIQKKEIVHLGIDPTILSAKNSGIHLEPEQAHELIGKKSPDLLILDTRNEFEYAIGRFENAIKSPLAHFRDFPSYIDGNLDAFKDKQVLMYCTGGVRCERATAYLKSKGVAQEVYQIKGGIHRYIEKFPNGFFKGKNYVFDGRTAVKVSEDILGSCYICKKACDEYNNCLRAACNRHFICCADCLATYRNTCSQECLDLITSGKASERPIPKKVYSNDSPNCSL